MYKNYFYYKLIIGLILLGFSQRHFGQQEDYDTVIENFNFVTTVLNDEPPYAGSYNNGVEFAQYANQGFFGSTPGAAAFRTFTIDGSDELSTARPLTIGDEFSITCFTSSNPSAGGRIGISFRNLTTYTDFSESTDGSTIARFQLDDSGGWKVYSGILSAYENSSATANSDRTFKIKIVSPTKFIATINGTTYYDINFGASTPLSSFAIYTYGDNNSNSFWKNASLTPTGSIEIGGSNANVNISGDLSDGLEANSISILKQNNLIKEGTGTVTLSGNNTFTGTTTVLSGTLKLQSSLAFSDVTVQNGATLEIDDDLTLKSLTVEPGANVVINDYILSVTNNLVLNSTSTLFSSLIAGDTALNVSGTITYNRWVNADGNTNNSGRDLVSPPVDGQQFNDFYTGNSTSLAAGAGAGDALFGPFDNSTGLYVEYATGETTTLNSGTGYRAGTIGTSGNTLTFTGTVNIGTLEVEITDLGATNYGSWNLIGNPDPCYLSFKDFFDLVSDVQTGPVAGPNNKLDGAYTAVYGYDADDTDPTGKIWTIWDFNNTSYATDLIAPGQGFFVKAKTGAGTTPGDTKVSFLPSMRRTGTSEDFITDNRAADQNLAHIELYLTNSNNSYTTNLYFRDINTRGLDPGYDTGAFRSDTSGIYTNLVEDNAGIALVNQSLPYNDLNNIIVPLGMNAPQGQQHTVSFVANALPQTINVYLEDNVANTWTLLNTGDYVFTPAATVNGSGRFFLHFTTGTLSAEDNELNGLQIYADNISRSIKVKGQLANDTKVSIFDLQGRIVLEQVLNNDVTTNEILVNTLNSGLYIVELQNGRQKLTQKVILE